MKEKGRVGEAGLDAVPGAKPATTLGPQEDSISALNTPAEKPGLVSLLGRLRPLPGLVPQQACTIPIIEHAKPQ
jgi:hypothetical protein